jgi:hypothetical protein
VTIEDVLSIVRPLVRMPMSLTRDTPVISSGLLDSFHVAVLLEDLRARGGVRIELDEIGVDNFDTPGQMLAFLQARS